MNFIIVRLVCLVKAIVIAALIEWNEKELYMEAGKVQSLSEERDESKQINMPDPPAGLKWTMNNGIAQMVPV